MDKEECTPLTYDTSADVYISLHAKWLALLNKRKHNMGSPGMRLSRQWEGEDGFINFYSWAIANGYDETKFIYKKNKSCPYSPDNCYISSNKKETKLSLLQSIKIGDMTAEEFAKEHNISNRSMLTYIDKGMITEKEILDYKALGNKRFRSPGTNPSISHSIDSAYIIFDNKY